MRMIMFLPMMIPVILQAGEKWLTLSSAMKKGLVTAEFKAKGGHLGDVMTLKLKNRSNEKLKISVDAGDRLIAKDSSEQNLVVTRPLTLTLVPGQTIQSPVLAMCINAHRSSPDKDGSYLLGTKSDSNLTQLVRLIDLRKWNDLGTAQSAVWVLTDRRPIESIGGEDTVSRELARTLSRLTGQPMPAFRMHYPDSCGYRNAAPLEISGRMTYELYSNGVITIGLYNALGEPVEYFVREMPRNKGSYEFRYSFKSSRLPKGVYYARIRVDGQLKGEQKFTF